MIITEKKSFNEILEIICKANKIFIIGCGECATVCKTGGENECLEMKSLLEKEGKTIIGFSVPSAPCISSKVKTELAKNNSLLKETEVILVLACGLGVQSVKENLKFKKEVLPGLNTLFIGILDSKGNFLERCSLCGDCILAKTETYCPLTMCAKGLLNGPCGGMNRGKCEVDKEKDCVWVLIYNNLKEKFQVNKLRQINPARNYLKIIKPKIIRI